MQLFPPDAGLSRFASRRRSDGAVRWLAGWWSCVFQRAGPRHSRLPARHRGHRCPHVCRSAKLAMVRCFVVRGTGQVRSQRDISPSAVTRRAVSLPALRTAPRHPSRRDYQHTIGSVDEYAVWRPARRRGTHQGPSRCAVRAVSVDRDSDCKLDERRLSGARAGILGARLEAHTWGVPPIADPCAQAVVFDGAAIKASNVTAALSSFTAGGTPIAVGCFPASASHVLCARDGSGATYGSGTTVEFDLSAVTPSSAVASTSVSLQLIQGASIGGTMLESSGSVAFEVGA